MSVQLRATPRLDLLVEVAGALARADALVAVVRVHRARLSKCHRKRDRADRNPRDLRTSRARPKMLRVAGYQPIKVAADGTCAKDDLVSLVVEMSETSGGLVAPFLEAFQDIPSHVVDGRVSAEYAAARLRTLATVLERC
mmetsp:Transcript_19939/g.61906  ORF Transcript_19939/g.61906 Transcript_19939/m.61906 type:complete len:140 (+) Transcript_19939:702-1121(+)